jgi:hypothetical protein
MPHNKEDIKRIHILSNPSLAAQYGIGIHSVTPSKTLLTEKEYTFTYLYHNTSSPKGWRSDGLNDERGWDCR